MKNASTVCFPDCVDCGSAFCLHNTDNGSAHVCPACRPAHKKRRDLEWHRRYKLQHGNRHIGRRTLTEHTCAHCTAAFMARKGQRYCSRTCYHDHQRAAAVHTSGKIYTRKQRLRLQHVEPVSRVAVLERDSWTCHLCSKKINCQLKYPHAKSASVDHIIPLAEGGTHEMANVRPAHLVCNQTKRDRGGGEQLLLIA